MIDDGVLVITARGERPVSDLLKSAVTLVIEEKKPRRRKLVKEIRRKWQFTKLSFENCGIMTKQPELSLDTDQIDATVLTLLGERNDSNQANTEQPKPKKRGRKRKEPADSSSDGEPKPAKRGRGRPSNASTAAAAAAAAAAASAARAAANSSPSSSSESVGEVCNAARERSRVKTLRDAFLDLQRSLPSVPPDTKLSKLDVLVLATTYIAHLMKTLDGDADVPALGALLRPGREARANGGKDGGETAANSDRKHRLKADGYLHPVKKWPMRSRLYAGALLGCVPNAS